jgi:outer membrane protein assembly factor BamB
MNKFFTCAMSIAVLSTTSAFSADWPEFSGPNRDNISKETGINKNWETNPPKEVWAAKIGPGFGGASIADGKVYILDRKDDQQDVLRCFDFATGNELWSSGYDAPGKPSYNGSRTTPTVSGNYVYTVGVFGDVYCFDITTQKPVWNKSFKEDFGSNPPNWAFAQSALVYKDKVIVAPMSPSAGMVALNPKTGEIIWKSKSIGGETYMSPTLLTIDGTDQIYMQTRENGNDVMAFYSINPENGEVFWRLQSEEYFNKIPIPFPTDLGNGLLFVTGGYGAGSCLVQVQKDGDSWKAEITKTMPKYGCQIHPLIHYDGYLYGNLNTNENLNSRRTEPDGLTCIKEDGEIVWQAKGSLPINRGGLIIVDGVMLVLGDEEGLLHMVECSPDGFNKLGSHKVFTELLKGDNNLWAPLSFADGKLIIRSQTEIKCFDLTS